MGAYPSALDAGMTPKEFWESTVAEIRDRLESYGGGKRPGHGSGR